MPSDILTRETTSRQQERVLRASIEMIFWQHDVSVTIPNNTWTPLPWNQPRNTLGVTRWSSLYENPEGFNPTVSLASTTIAAGSDAAALPQATINVASTTGFAAQGYILIRIGGTDRVVEYSGLNATQFTGCSLGVGTMNTGNLVRQGVVVIDKPDLSANACAEVAWASNATGKRGIRWRTKDLVLNLALGTTIIPAAAMTTDLMHIQSVEQPVNVFLVPPTDLRIGTVVEVYQDSGAPLDSVVSSLSAPRIVAFNFPTERSSVTP